MVERNSDLLDGTYAALAHAVRREMVCELRRRDRRVTDLAAPFDVSLAAASKHIRVLERAGLVRRTIVGRDHVLSLQVAPLVDARDWIDENRRLWEGRLDALEARLKRGGRA